MRIDTNLITQHNLSENCVLEYFGTLYEVISHFRCTGEEILRRNGFRDSRWVQSLFKIAADHHCFANTNCPEGLPFEVVLPLITPELVADFCLASNILETAFYEYLLFQQYQKVSALPLTKDSRRALRDLRIARRKFCKQKTEYMNLACDQKLPHELTRACDVCTTHKGNILQPDVMFALELMPIIFQLCPRDKSAVDTAPLRKLYRKYAHLFYLCAKSES